MRKDYKKKFGGFVPPGVVKGLSKYARPVSPVVPPPEPEPTPTPEAAPQPEVNAKGGKA